MAQYLVLIYETEESYAALAPDEMNAITSEYMAFGEKNAAAVDGGNALQPTSTATTIRPDGNGGFTVTDGPFVETKEALGGYYLISADDLDAAIAIAKQVPARFGGVEVRPIMTFS
jgi:hypothetical protein